MSNLTPKMPEFKATRSGYEIRTDILEMAKDAVESEYHAKFHEWEVSSFRDEKTNQLVTTVNMPTFPGLDKILETAEKMYAFVNNQVNNK